MKDIIRKHRIILVILIILIIIFFLFYYVMKKNTNNEWYDDNIIIASSQSEQPHYIKDDNKPNNSDRNLVQIASENFIKVYYESENKKVLEDLMTIDGYTKFKNSGDPLPEDAPVDPNERVTIRTFVKKQKTFILENNDGSFDTLAIVTGNFNLNVDGKDVSSIVPSIIELNLHKQDDKFLINSFKMSTFNNNELDTSFYK